MTEVHEPTFFGMTPSQPRVSRTFAVINELSSTLYLRKIEAHANVAITLRRDEPFLMGDYRANYGRSTNWQAHCMTLYAAAFFTEPC